MSYKFIGQTSNSNKYFDKSPDDSNLTKYYQVCVFKNPTSGKYHVRRCVINSSNEFVNVREFELNEKRYKKLLDTHGKHEYKLYPAYDLNAINLPSSSDVTLSKSDILNKFYDYSGFAPF